MRLQHGSGLSVRASAVALFAVIVVVSPQAKAQYRAAMNPSGTTLAYIKDKALRLQPTVPQSPSIKIDEADDFTAVPTWSPDGSKLAYYRKLDGELQLWIYEVSSGSRRQLTSLVGGISPNLNAYFGGWGSDTLRFSWSPDGKMIAFASDVIIPRSKEGNLPSYPTLEDIRAGKPVILTGETPASWTLHGVVSYGDVASFNFGQSDKDRLPPKLVEPRATQLFTIDVSSGRTRQITSDNKGYFTPAWSPDGKSLAYMSPGKADFSRFEVETNIFIKDLKSGVDRQLTSGPTQKLLPTWSPSGAEIAYHWRDARGRFARAGEGINILPASAGPEATPLNITPSLDRWITGFAWSGDSNGVFLLYRDGLSWPLAFADRQAKGLRRLSRAGAVVRDFASGQYSVAWIEVDDPNSDAAMLALPLPTLDGATVITSIARKKNPRRLEKVSWTNTGGDDLEGLLIYPKDYVAGRRYPLVVDAYSSINLDLEGYEETPNQRASDNYFIFLPNHRSPHMWVNGVKGAAHDAAAVGPRGIKVMTDDILTGVALLERQGLVDSTKMCVYGHSNGGLQGELLLTETDRFKCGAFVSPATSNWLTMYLMNTDDDETRYWMNGMDPWIGREYLASLSPVYLADRIDTPVLLAVGDQEQLVIPTIEIFNGMRSLKRDVTLLRYSETGHVITGKPLEDFTARLRDFFGKHLQ